MKDHEPSASCGDQGNAAVRGVVVRIRVGDLRLRTRKTVIATGARAAMPPIPGLDAVGAHTNETIFDLDAPPRRLAILGRARSAVSSRRRSPGWACRST